MGTRADFYLGRGEQAEWLGSIAWDGYPSDIDLKAVIAAADADTYRQAVSVLLARRKDATTPKMGWPWPWMDSQLTDYAYAFDEDQVWASSFGSAWFPASEPRPEDSGEGPKVALFPYMAGKQQVTLGPRSGLIII